MNQIQNELAHHGVLGMKWGVRRERKAAERSEQKDMKWAHKQGAKITEKTRKSVDKDMSAYVKEALGDNARNASGKLSMTYINSYNKKLAELMNNKVSSVKAPSGKVMRYVAKRGEIGVHTALADQGYNMDKVKNGIHASGRVAYKKEVLKKG